MTPPIIKNKFMIKSDDLKNVMADNWTLRYIELTATNSLKKDIETIRKISELAYDNFGIPMNANDSFQIQEFIVNTMKGMKK